MASKLGTRIIAQKPIKTHRSAIIISPLQLLRLFAA